MLLRVAGEATSGFLACFLPDDAGFTRKLRLQVAGTPMRSKRWLTFVQSAQQKLPHTMDSVCVDFAGSNPDSQGNFG